VDYLTLVESSAPRVSTLRVSEEDAWVGGEGEQGYWIGAVCLAGLCGWVGVYYRRKGQEEERREHEEDVMLKVREGGRRIEGYTSIYGNNRGCYPQGEGGREENRGLYVHIW